MAESVRILEKMSVEEFLDWVETQPVPYELIDGTPRPKYAPEEMNAGGSVNHGFIADNILVRLTERLRGKPCRPFGSKIGVEAGERKFLYPDVGVDCGFRDRPLHAKKAVKPALVVEVLSPSTEGYDQGKKFNFYENILSIKYILYVEQDAPFVKLYARQSENNWLVQLHRKLDETVRFPDLDVELTMNEIYEDVNFPISPAPDSA